MADISVLILTYNEERHIERCLHSLKLFAKNIFVIDSFSTDRTVEIARDLGAAVLQHSWPGNHAEQFQWGLENAPIDTEWVMKLDADEYVLPELAEEINSKLESLGNEISAVYMKRRVHFMGKWIKYGGYYPTWLLRIWRHGRGRMEQRWMDEHIKLISGRSVRFENDFVDDNRHGLTAWTEKHNNYATREAVDILNTIYTFREYESVAPDLFGTQEERKRWLKIKYASMPLFMRPLLYFMFRYFIKVGFLDGVPGLIWHTLQGGWYRFLVDAKIYEIYNKAGRDRDKILNLLADEYNIDLKEG